MEWIASYLWLIPALPLLAAAIIAVTPRSGRRRAAFLAIGAMAAAFVLSVLALATVIQSAGPGTVLRDPASFTWFEFGDQTLRLGWILDPLSAVMAVMVTSVGTLIFIYSAGYMAHDDNFTRFFGFLALFAAAMLGLVIANSLLLLFICWELVGLASYLLIGFWFHKPAAAAAAKKAFITTRIGDLGFLLGILWLYGQTGTLLFYDEGRGCLERSALTAMVAQTTVLGLGVSTAISLLLFCGAIGKSGQLPLHVWLPDAMEGPTPVSALIHAATMVAAGVFLVARVYPLMALHLPAAPAQTTALQVVTWVGALTAVFAALIAVAQTDLKRILAYSTVSQLGFMMLGLGVGGVAVGMFHLITHAFFKALLFLGAGSVIHGAQDEQDIRRLGGLRRFMPVTFATYAVGMMALAGVPLFFSGFWSKDEILHAAHLWPPGKGPFYLGLFGALLTAFYMTRQVCLVFYGTNRSGRDPRSFHESPPVMTVPLIILAVFAVGLGFLGTPAWPWFKAFIDGGSARFEAGRLLEWDHLSLMLSSSMVVLGSLALGWGLYGRNPRQRVDDADALEQRYPAVYRLLQSRFRVDEFYAATFVRWTVGWAWLCDLLDRWLWGGLVFALGLATNGLAWLSHFIDEYVVNLGFDAGCRRIRESAAFSSQFQDGQVQNYLRALALALAVLVLLLTWGRHG